jgi:hypothetical protein
MLALWIMGERGRGERAEGEGRVETLAAQLRVAADLFGRCTAEEARPEQTDDYGVFARRIDGHGAAGWIRISARGASTSTPARFHAVR